MKLRTILATGLLALGAAGAVFADSDTKESRNGWHHGHHRMGASIEHVAMHNIMAGLLAAKTGRPEAEIRALFETSGPHEAIEKLGLSRDDMHALMEQAHETLLTKSVAAGLITAEQAQKIRSMPRLRHDGHDGPPPAE